VVCALELNSGEVPAISGQWRGYDGLQHGEEISRASTAPSISSSGWRGDRLETSRASGVDDLLAPLRNRTIPKNQEMRQRVGRQIGEKGRTGAHW
jgi:hypothetical protein